MVETITFKKDQSERLLNFPKTAEKQDSKRSK